MRFSICIGSYAQPEFIELGLRSCRRIFGDAPIIIYDGASPESERVKELADRFEASYVTESVNRGHFMGCITAAVCALAFARANDCEVAIKLNQRFVLLSEEIPTWYEEVFAREFVEIAIPLSPKPETIHSPGSSFHAKFTVSPACIAMRASKIGPEWLLNKYMEQVRDGKSRHDTLTEEFWRRLCEVDFKNHVFHPDWLREPSNPPAYLQKCQHDSASYLKAAVALGMEGGNFETAEWAAISGAAYRPGPR